ncbi:MULTISPECIES: hypothetical protein [Roseateles]|uniref:Uncharacterized protein n=1 Tax=Roseateles albus TaxID=2987525 RepID=A0ABT5KDA3_9BURK|nr:MULTISPECIES: hypothetical protein [Roseateles]MCV2357905.1 hypothetical protein [Paucibacter sp. TC2R-5]MDC8770970.1 hypothetical protein [Roseateles albus]
MSALFTFITRVIFALVTVVLVLCLMGVAIVTMIGLVIWSLLRGRKPVLDTSRFTRARSFRAGPRGAAAKPMGEVIDVEVREVPDKLPPQP